MPRRIAVCFALSTALLTSPHIARARSNLRVAIVGSIAGAVPRARPVQALLGERVVLYAVVSRRERGRWRVYTDAPSSARLGWRRLHRARPLSALSGLSLRWVRVEPQPHHVNTAPPNKGNKAYSNAVLFGRRHGQWIGFDTLEYFESAIAGANGGRLSLTRTRPTHKRVNVNGGLGTMRYRVYATLDGETVATPGAKPTMKRGVSTRVFRVSFRAADDFVGYLTGYFNVPNVFGSAPGKGRAHQTERYQGADCADVISGGARRAGAPVPYVSVAALRNYAYAVTGKLLLDSSGLWELVHDKRTGKVSRGKRVTLAWGSTRGALRRGDIMLIDYVGFNGSPRAWDHVAVLRRDNGTTRGTFDAKDRILHMGYLFGLTDTTAGSEGPAVVKFLRFRARYQRAFTRNARRVKRARARRAKLVHAKSD
ncbi:MAG: hypothetical protein KC503_18960 [Myxococcales bacterium]|nr:hypothetical protein [Myxococcales bacterium]